ncbi:TPA: hypothetical protein IAC10_13605 [Candidatus Scatousia excrementigallinarum]|uniref:Uncharacterized protein n=1 Tax=Candidatus Scatousia excrementigallinarum TaxID=2840935 RepID=A0A9D1F1H2_9BACT|nr:hypothetical protein [Candidatus Scatousia excrementigallinarum]
MQVSRVQVFKNNYNIQGNSSRVNAHPNAVNNHGLTPTPAATVFDCRNKKIPCDFRYNSNVSFGEFFDPNRTVPHIDYEEYMAMNENTKKRFRKKYSTFMRSVDKNELADLKFLYLPLQTEKSMENFIKISNVYNKYKEQPIICLGRSPKWFLNTALWMKDGIDDYKFVAFSKYWYRPDYNGVKRLDEIAPTEKEELAYRKYLKRIKADPQTIVDNMEKTGKKTVITDYICSGKGACSFLDVMSRYADDLGILEKFAKSIQIVGIGSMEYMEDLNPYAEYISEPSVPMPEKLFPYRKEIKQEFYNMDYQVFRDMLLNQNTNECRSTYYPHEMWTIYKPDQFKTGLIHDMKKVKEMAKKVKTTKQSMSSFTPAMYDFRNLLNFHILDGLNKQGLLKLVHRSKI